MRGYLLKLSLFQAVMFSRVNYSLFIYEQNSFTIRYWGFLFIYYFL